MEKPDVKMDDVKGLIVIFVFLIFITFSFSGKDKNKDEHIEFKHEYRIYSLQKADAG